MKDYIENSDRVIPSHSFCTVLSVNVNNDKLSDAAFRSFVKDTLDLVQFVTKKMMDIAEKQK